VNGHAGASENDELDQLLRGVGQVCIAASLLDSTLAYVCMIIDGWSGDQYDDVLSNGRIVEEYGKLVKRLEAAGFGPEARKILEDTKRLRRARNRVVHSVMMTEVKMGRFYDAWHPRTRATWPVEPAKLNQLAEDLRQCNYRAGKFVDDWADLAERDGWPELP
jgi:hypothetical protein